MVLPAWNELSVKARHDRRTLYELIRAEINGNDTGNDNPEEPETGG